MESIDSNELWRFIPPEEKITLLTRAQTSGVTSALAMIMIAGTIAVGLQEIWVFYASFLICPLLYQLTAGRTWRGLKPRLMLEYLGARSAARRYAFTTNSKDLMISVLFRGTVREDFVDERLNETLSDSIFGNQEASVWIALFTDAIVLMEEQPGGASLRFGHLINDKLNFSGSSNGYDNDLEVVLTSTDKRIEGKRYSIRSHHPAALTVFMKKIEEYKEAYTLRINGPRKAIEAAVIADDDDDIFARSSF